MGSRSEVALDHVCHTPCRSRRNAASWCSPRRHQSGDHVTSYELLVTLHVIAAMVWVGSATIYLVLHQYLHSRVPRSQMFEVLHHTDRIAPFVFLPAILSTLTFGALVVATQDAWAFSDLWVSLGLGGLLLSFALGFVSGVPMAASLTALKDRVGLDAAHEAEGEREQQAA